MEHRQQASVEIVRMGPEEWELVKAVRVRSLKDSPDAFCATLADVEKLEPEEWRLRLANPDAATFVALADGKGEGLVVGKSYDDRPGSAGLFSMWVSPAVRGRGIAGALVDAVIAWAKGEGKYERIFLEVGDHNTAAIQLYESRSFLPTGKRGTLPPPKESILEHERMRVL